MANLYVIHTSPKRIKFVNEYMVPCFKRYGIQDIIVWNDEQMIGQLNAWTDCARWIVSEKNEYRGTWHLEDDVVPCKNFKTLSEQLSGKSIVVQGFITDNKFFGFKGETGILPFQYLPYGMQCIYIPNLYLKGFIDFVDTFVKTGMYRKKQYECGTLYSDAVFRTFMKRYYKDTLINNLDDCMVEHVDYLIGGSSVRKQKDTKAKARKFDNYEEVERLERWLAQE